MALMLEPDFKFAAEDVKEFFAFVRIGFAAAAAGFDAKEMRLHGGVAPGEQLHADFGICFENFAFRGANERGGVAVGVEKRDDVGFVEAGNAAKCGDGRMHLAALERAEETNGNVSGAGDLREREAALNAQTTKMLAGRLARFGGNDGDTLFFQDVNDGCGIEAAGAAQKNGALQKAYIGFGVEAITALRALGSDEAERFPGTQRGGRNAEAARDFGDAQKSAMGQRFR